MFETGEADRLVMVPRASAERRVFGCLFWTFELRILNLFRISDFEIRILTWCRISPEGSDSCHLPQTVRE
jgi:hypothetical protein